MLLTIAETAERLRVSARTVEREIAAGLVACGSASDDPAQRVEKPAQVAPSKARAQEK